MFSTFFQKIVPFYEVMSKNMASQKLQKTIWRLVIYWISKATCAQAHVHAFALTHPHTPHMQERTHAHTKTPTYLVRISFPRQQLFRERASVFCYTCIACIVVFILHTRKESIRN